MQESLFFTRKKFRLSFKGNIMKNFPFRKVFAILFIIVAFAWIWLFFSEQGILVDSEAITGTPEPTLECTYFTGTGFFTKEVTEGDGAGSLDCAGMSNIK